jgi:hypothetical protein
MFQLVGITGEVPGVIVAAGQILKRVRLSDYLAESVLHPFCCGEAGAWSEEVGSPDAKKAALKSGRLFLQFGLWTLPGAKIS